MEGRMPSKHPPPAPEIPAFTSDRMRLMAPMLSPRIIALAQNRIIICESFFKNGALQVEASEVEVRLALMVALEIHPRLELDNFEQGLLRGMDRKAYSNKSKAGDLVR